MGSRLDKNNCININFFSAKWMMVSHRWIINNKAMGCALVIFYFLGQKCLIKQLKKEWLFWLTVAGWSLWGWG